MSLTTLTKDSNYSEKVPEILFGAWILWSVGATVHCGPEIKIFVHKFEGDSQIWAPQEANLLTLHLWEVEYIGAILNYANS